MFTGIIEEIGIVLDIKKGAKSSKLQIKASKIFDDLKIGDSVATNGVCLTVTEFDKNKFVVDIMNVTLTRSSLKNLKVGQSVNLERAMIANGRFGGHIVSGHIDGVGEIVSIDKDDIAIWYKIKASKNIMNYIIEKGSIAIDGISLTVAKLEKDTFSVSIIPHTAKETILSNKKNGDLVNLENDMIGKYIEKFIKISAGENSSDINSENNKNSNITAEFLIKNGF